MLLQHANWKGAATSCLQHNKSRLGKTLIVNNSNNNKPESRLKASPAAPRTARKLLQKLVPHSVHFDKLYGVGGGGLLALECVLSAEVLIWAALNILQGIRKSHTIRYFAI